MKEKKEKKTDKKIEYEEARIFLLLDSRNKLDNIEKDLFNLRNKLSDIEEEILNIN